MPRVGGGGSSQVFQNECRAKFDDQIEQFWPAQFLELRHDTQQCSLQLSGDREVCTLSVDLGDESGRPEIPDFIHMMNQGWALQYGESNGQREFLIELYVLATFR